MSKAVRINLTESVSKLLVRAISLANSTRVSLPSIPEMPLPDLPCLALDIPLIDALAPAHAPRVTHEITRETQPWVQHQETLFPEEPVIKKKDLHLDIVSLLERSGYEIKDVAPLPSDEKRITLSDLFEDYPNKAKEYAYRR